MPELLFTSSVDPIKEGQRFAGQLPRHVTLWQYFRLQNEQCNALIAQTAAVVDEFSPMTIQGGERALFGPENNVPVRRVISLGRGAMLAMLHDELGVVLEHNHATVKNPEWAYENYRPHMTYVDGRALEEGEQATLQTLELIEKDSSTKNKIVRKIWKLKEA